MKSSVRLLPLAFAVLLCGGCAMHLKRVDSVKFLKYGQSTLCPGSATVYEYIGASSSRAYIQMDSAIALSAREDTQVFWIPIAELPEPVRKEIEAGRNPWSPALDDTTQSRKANKPPVATSTAVTVPAGAGPAPSVAAPHR